MSRLYFVKARDKRNMAASYYISKSKSMEKTRRKSKEVEENRKKAEKAKKIEKILRIIRIVGPRLFFSTASQLLLKLFVFVTNLPFVHTQLAKRNLQTTRVSTTIKMLCQKNTMSSIRQKYTMSIKKVSIKSLSTPHLL